MGRIAGWYRAGSRRVERSRRLLVAPFVALILAACTTVTLVDSPKPSFRDQPATFRAVVAPTNPSGPQPTGSVSFYDGETLLGTAALSNGAAKVTVSDLSDGSHTITARYSGDATYMPWRSAVVGHVVELQPPLAVAPRSISTIAVLSRGDAGSRFDIRTSNSSGAPTAQISFGAFDAIPVAGDWDGDGTETIGVFNPSASSWALRNSNSGGAPDISEFSFGNASAQPYPVVGDWNGDGIDTIGVYYQTNGVFDLRDHNNAGGADYSFQFGNPATGPIGVAGDWNGDGRDGIGVYHRFADRWDLRDGVGAGAPDYSFRFGGAVGNPLRATRTRSSVTGTATASKRSEPTSEPRVHGTFAI